MRPRRAKADEWPMGTSYCLATRANTGKNLQAWHNTVAGESVYAEGVVVVDSTGTEKLTSANPGTVAEIAATSGGCSIYHVVSAPSNNTSSSL